MVGLLINLLSLEPSRSVLIDIPESIDLLTYAYSLLALMLSPLFEGPILPLIILSLSPIEDRVEFKP